MKKVGGVDEEEEEEEIEQAVIEIVEFVLV